jgi:hypothetical protein
VLSEENLTDDTFVHSVNKLYENRSTYIENMKKNEGITSINKVVELIKAVAK